MTESTPLFPPFAEEMLPGGGHRSFVLKRGQLLRLMHRIINRRFTRFVFVFLRLRNAQRHRANFVQPRLQRAIQ